MECGVLVVEVKLGQDLVIQNPNKNSSSRRFFLNLIQMVCAFPFFLSFECLAISLFLTDLFQTAKSGVSVISSIPFKISD
jgi:hypothetical protein